MNGINIFERLRGLQPPAPVLIGKIVADLGDGLARVEQPGGGMQQLRNTPAVPAGQWVFFQGTAILGEAPNFVPVLIEI